MSWRHSATAQICQICLKGLCYTSLKLLFELSVQYFFFDFKYHIDKSSENVSSILFNKNVWDIRIFQYWKLDMDNKITIYRHWQSTFSVFFKATQKVTTSKHLNFSLSEAELIDRNSFGKYRLLAKITVSKSSFCIHRCFSFHWVICYFFFWYEVQFDWLHSIKICL